MYADLQGQPLDDYFSQKLFADFNVSLLKQELKRMAFVLQTTELERLQQKQEHDQRQRQRQQDEEDTTTNTHDMRWLVVSTTRSRDDDDTNNNNNNNNNNNTMRSRPLTRIFGIPEDE
jgi:hypothetical protein